MLLFMLIFACAHDFVILDPLARQNELDIAKMKVEMKYLNKEDIAVLKNDVNHNKTQISRNRSRSLENQKATLKLHGKIGAVANKAEMNRLEFGDVYTRIYQNDEKHRKATERMNMHERCRTRQARRRIPACRGR